MTNFGGLSEELMNYSQSEIVIIPVPFDGTSTWIKGADKGPQAILEASENMELYDIETDSEVYLKGIHTTDFIDNVDTPEQLAEKLKPVLLKIFRDKKFPVVLGGEHSVSIGAFQAVGECFENISILQLDAHSDMRDEYEGSKFNHACVMARAKEICPVTQVGIRSSCIEEKKNINQERIFYAHDIKQSKEDCISKVVNQLSENVYLTIDLDVLDPAFLPATGTPEPDGLSYRDILNLVKKVIDNKKLVGMDVVELAPIENNKASDFLAAKLIYQILSYQFLKK